MDKLKRITFELSRLILACIFAYAGFIKFLNPQKFYDAILAYDLLENNSVYALSYFLPPLEILLAVSLYIKSTVKISASILILLNLIFIIAIMSAWLRGLDISCGCFGVSVTEGEYFMTILRDLFFILCAICILLFNSEKICNKKYFYSN